MFSYVQHHRPKRATTKYMYIQEQLDELGKTCFGSASWGTHQIPEAWANRLRAQQQGGLSVVECAKEWAEWIHARPGEVPESRSHVDFFCDFKVGHTIYTGKIDVHWMKHDADGSIYAWSMYLRVMIDDRMITSGCRFPRKNAGPDNVFTAMADILPIIHDAFSLQIPNILQQSELFPSFDSEKSLCAMRNLKNMEKRFREHHGSRSWPRLFVSDIEDTEIKFNTVKQVIDELAKVVGVEGNFNRIRKVPNFFDREYGWELKGYAGYGFTVDFNIWTMDRMDPSRGFVEIHTIVEGDGFAFRVDYREHPDAMGKWLDIFYLNALGVFRTIDENLMCMAGAD